MGKGVNKLEGAHQTETESLCSSQVQKAQDCMQELKETCWKMEEEMGHFGVQAGAAGHLGLEEVQKYQVEDEVLMKTKSEIRMENSAVAASYWESDL